MDGKEMREVIEEYANHAFEKIWRYDDEMRNLLDDFRKESEGFTGNPNTISRMERLLSNMQIAQRGAKNNILNDLTSELDYDGYPLYIEDLAETVFLFAIKSVFDRELEIAINNFIEEVENERRYRLQVDE